MPAQKVNVLFIYFYPGQDFVHSTPAVFVCFPLPSSDHRRKVWALSPSPETFDRRSFRGMSTTTRLISVSLLALLLLASPFLLQGLRSTPGFFRSRSRCILLTLSSMCRFNSMCAVKFPDFWSIISVNRADSALLRSTSVLANTHYVDLMECGM